MRRRAVSARGVLAGHSWAIGLLETRGSMGPATMRYLDAILGNLRSAGFSIEDAVHAFWLLDSYVYGHVIQETSLAPAGTPPPRTESTERCSSRPRWPSTRIWPSWPNTPAGPTTASIGSSGTAWISSSTHWSGPRPRRVGEQRARRRCRACARCRPRGGRRAGPRGLSPVFCSPAAAPLTVSSSSRRHGSAPPGAAAGCVSRGVQLGEGPQLQSGQRVDVGRAQFDRRAQDLLALQQRGLVQDAQHGLLGEVQLGEDALGDVRAPTEAEEAAPGRGWSWPGSSRRRRSGQRTAAIPGRRRAARRRRRRPPARSRGRTIRGCWPGTGPRRTPRGWPAGRPGRDRWRRRCGAPGASPGAGPRSPPAGWPRPARRRTRGSRPGRGRPSGRHRPRRRPGRRTGAPPAVLRAALAGVSASSTAVVSRSRWRWAMVVSA